MKNTLKKVFTAVLTLFGVLLVMSYVGGFEKYNTAELRSLLVVIYLFTSLKYFQMEVKDKNAEIQDLKRQLTKKLS